MKEKSDEVLLIEVENTANNKFLVFFNKTAGG